MKKNPHFSVVAATAPRFPNLLFVSWARVFASIVALLVFSPSLCHAVQSCTLAWNASSDSTVAGYRVRYGTTSGSTAQTKDAGSATTTTVSALSDGVTYYFTVVGYTSANVESQPSNEVSYKTPTTPPATASIWPSNAAPTVADSGSDDPNVELGVKFRSDVSGIITGIRFYKAATNTGAHVASLWTSTGTLLATATSTGETASGWQKVNFPAPVSITANTVYVASYHCDNGHYSQDTDYFSSTTGVDNPPLHALPSTSSNGNGVFAYGNGTVFPNQSWKSSNYWVDVIFQN
jgi:hypothetical protein